MASVQLVEKDNLKRAPQIREVRFFSRETLLSLAYRQAILILMAQTVHTAQACLPPAGRGIPSLFDACKGAHCSRKQKQSIENLELLSLQGLDEALLY